MKRFRDFLILSITLLIFHAGLDIRVSKAQHWQQVSVPSNVHIFTPYFLNRNYGFLFTPGLTAAGGQATGWSNLRNSFQFDGQVDPPAVYRTLDGGNTWLTMNIGEISSQSYAVLLQMQFDSPSHGYIVGYVADSVSGYEGGLYETIDSGSNWNRISPNGLAFQSLCISDSFVFLISVGTPEIIRDTIFFYNVNTKTFREVVGDKAGVSITGNGGSIIYSHHANGTMRSSNDGKTWTNAEIGDSTIESWSLYALKGSNIIYRAAENVTGYADNVPCYGNIQISTDGGASWSNSYIMGPFPRNIYAPVIGDIDGDACTVYVSQTLESSDSGLLRSTNQGSTWQQVGGPIHSCDGRSLSVVEKGAVVYAAENEGDLDSVDFNPAPWTRLWKTTDGGDGFFNRIDTPTITVSKLPIVSACDHSQGSVKLEYQSCYVNLSLDSITVSGDTQYFSLDSLPLFPTVFSVQGGSGFVVKFDPQLHPGTFTDSIHIHCSVPGQTASLDTVIIITATATPVPPQLASSQSALNFGTITTCVGFASRDSNITFTNSGCALDTITNLTLNGSGFTGPNDTLPIIVPPGDSVKLEYRFVPPDSGAFTGQAQLNVVSMGLTENPVIDLSGQGVQGLGVLDVRSMGLQAGSFSFCTGDTTLTDTISNTGCDTLVISNIRFAGGSAFSLLLVSGDSLLLPGASRVFQFHFVPRTKGAQSATLTFHSQNIVNDAGHDTTITLAGIGLGGTKILAADTSLRDLGGLYACQSRDTTIVLSNPGCDTLRIDSGTVTNGTYSTGAIYPIILPPDSSVPVAVHLTADSAGMNGTLTFFSDANEGDSVVTIPLAASIIPPAHLLLALSPSDTATDGTLVTCYVLLEGQVPSGAISGMQFDITHNDDLLSFVNASGVTMTGTAGTPEAQVLHFAVGSQAGSLTYADTIGTITFRVYLSDSIFTPLSLSNVTFTNSLSLSDDCVASILDSGASFTYLYRCGEPIIQDAMENVTPFAIESIVPNPAGDEIEIRVVAGDPASLFSIEMYDALGRSVLAQGTTPQPPPSIGGGVILDVSGMPSGIYYLRLSSNGYVQSRSVVVQK